MYLMTLYNKQYPTLKNNIKRFPPVQAQIQSLSFP